LREEKDLEDPVRPVSKETSLKNDLRDGLDKDDDEEEDLFIKEKSSKVLLGSDEDDRLYDSVRLSGFFSFSVLL
jgi:hypothetical protein